MTINAAKRKVHFLNADMGADFTPVDSSTDKAQINIEQNKRLAFHLAWSAGPLGTIIVEAKRPNDVWFPVTLTSDMLQGASADATLNSGGDIELDGTLAGGISINIKDPFAEMRVRWDWDSVDASDLISCWFEKN